MKLLFFILTAIIISPVNINKQFNGETFETKKKEKKLQLTSTYELVKEAIKNKQSVTCYYNGYLRKMSPHVIGTKNGRQQALFYQYGGESEQGLNDNPNRNWRCIFIDKIKGISINDDDFETADNHSQRQSCVDYVDVKVDY